MIGINHGRRVANLQADTAVCPKFGVQLATWRFLVRAISRPGGFVRTFPANLRVADRNEAATRGTKNTNGGPVGPPFDFLTRLARLVGLLGFKEDHRGSRGFRSLQPRRLVLPFPAVAHPCRFREPFGSWLVNRTFARIAVAHGRCVFASRLVTTRGGHCQSLQRHRLQIPILQAGLVECFWVV